MITEGPFALSAGTPLALSDPGVGGGMAKVQIQNQSGFTLKVVNGTTTSSIQSYWVQTISLVPGGTGITILPAADGTGIGTNALTVVWLLSYESPPMADGALSAADIAIAKGTVDATILGSVTIEGATQATSTFGTVNASAQDTVTTTSTTTSTTLIPAPSSTERLQLFGGTISSGGSAGGGELQTTTGTVISLSPTSTAPLSLQYDGATLPAGEGVVIYGASATVPVSASLNYSVIPA